MGTVMTAGTHRTVGSDPAPWLGSWARTLGLAVGVVLSLAALGAGASAQMHEDTRLGFKFKPPKHFDPVPLGLLEGRMVAKFQSTKKSTNASSRYQYNVLSVYFFPEESLDQDLSHDDAVDALLQTWSEDLGEYEMLKDKRSSMLRRPTIERHISPVDGFSTLFQFWLDQEDGVFLFHGWAFKERFKKEYKDFYSAAKSFKRIEKDAPPAVAVADGDAAEGEAEEVDPAALRDAMARAAKASLPDGWDWMETDRMLVLYNADRDFVKDAASMLEGLYAAMEADLPKEQDETLRLLRVCSDRNAYQAYGGGSRTGWNLLTKELVTYESTPPAQSLMGLKTSAFQQYNFFRHGYLVPHPWYQEGYSLYYGGAEISSTGKVRGYGDHPPPFELAPTASQGKRALEKGDADGFTPLREFFALEYQPYYDNYWTHRAQAWALMHMFNQKTLRVPAWKTLLTDYLEALKAARLELAEEERDAEIAQFERNLEFATEAEAETERQNAPSDDPERYFHEVDQAQLRALAYERTFGDWSDDDWEELQDAFLGYVDTL